ncbi:MAG: VCBS repeat-containing protein [Thermoprotei archaeon]|nr:VCBS repeat-containing protein [Thermoprotei archaeon]
MNGRNRFWSRLVLDARPPVHTLDSLAVGDIDNDGNVEIITGGSGGLLWYRPATFEHGIIRKGDDFKFGVGIALDDIDADGLLEVATGLNNSIVWFKHSYNLRNWEMYVIDPRTSGSAHDMTFCDLDGDGVNELIANATYCREPGLFIYKPKDDVKAHWHKFPIVTGIFSEGLAVGDINNDGVVEVIHGPDLFVPPLAGPFAGLWKRIVYAPSFREMCRTALADITGNGFLDIIIVESEYVDGRLSWFENIIKEDGRQYWVEHKLEDDLVFAHSLYTWSDNDEVHIFVAEMAAGGWGQPYNWKARLIEYVTSDGGKHWKRFIIDKGMGTHQALLCDIDGDGELEIIGKEWGARYRMPRVQIWKAMKTPPFRFTHYLIDRDKPYPATDIVLADVDNDGLCDIVCGSWWYRAPNWVRYTIPGIYQVHCAYDLDGDGRMEFIATKRKAKASNWYDALSSDFVWIKPIDPVNGVWEIYNINRGSGDWPSSALVAPVLPEGRLALIVSYHNAKEGYPPELFEIPDNPKDSNWCKRKLANILYDGEIVVCDINSNGLLDIIAGSFLLENKGNGKFTLRRIADIDNISRIRVVDVNGDGRLDIVFTVKSINYETKEANFAPVGWLENKGVCSKWPAHIIDKIRSPHSLDVVDIDGDGKCEVVVGEHDPFHPYRSHSRLLIYKKAEVKGRAWYQYVVDSRFEHYNGTRVLHLASKTAIVSHGLSDSRYVHLWLLIK